MRTLLSIDKQSTTPVGRQIYDAWQQGILRGRFSRGERAPASRELAASLGVSRSTVTQVYEQLVSEGYLVSKHGSGTFICHELPEAHLQARAVGKSATAKAEISLSDYGNALRKGSPALPKTRGWIDFSHWDPDMLQFPFALWKRLMMKQMRSIDSTVFNYALHAAGHWPLRCEIAKYLGRSRAVDCKPEQIIIVNGSQQGLDLAARVLLNAGDKVLIEDPCYSGARRVFEALDARLIPARIDHAGMQCNPNLRGVRVAYVTPSHQFPTGVSMSLARRLELLAWAQKEKVVIIEDDYDSEFRYNGPPLPALQGLDTSASIIYSGTFSKVMFPGLRIGYLVVPESLIPILTRAKWTADRHTPILEQAALTEFIADGYLERHIRRMRKLYSARRDVLISSLQQHFADRVHISGIDAGMHALARIEDKSLATRAARNKVHIRSAAPNYLEHAPSNEYLFGFSSLSERVIREGIKRIAR